MKVFVAGASGAIGRRLVPLLVANGHRVIAATRTPHKAGALRAQGAEALVVDGLDREAVHRAVMATRPEAVVHQMTALAGIRSLKHFDHEFLVTNQLRTDGTRYLIEAGQAAGTRKIVAQSYTGWPNERRGGRVKSEDDPLDSHPPRDMAETLAAIRMLEHLVLNAPGMVGTVLRYGSLYGPGTSISDHGEVVEQVRRRRFPVVGAGAAVWSFTHVDDAARSTLLAIEHDAPGVFNIVDDGPAEVAEWLPELARAVGAAPPRHVPAWIARFLIGDAGVILMDQARGASNAKAKRALAWRPKYASWREGFRRGLAPEEPSRWA